ncbi:MAG: anhydro-N-acetylmuramic acid kinase [Patiriisocius sp.]|jgi:anhydro-N-acetylmuramic acid kinase
MIKQTYKVLGVMSGTSLDGIDLAVCYFDIQKKTTYRIESAITIPYSDHWKNKLQEAVSFSSEMLAQLDIAYTPYLGSIIKAFIEENKIEDLDAVCSHGHTILHQPDKGITLQIGNLKKISEIIGERVVCDFRVQDIQLGGQGAPLVPIGDRLLFSIYDYCLNLGGFANVSLTQEGVTIAYDICPLNIVMNHYAEKLGVPYDAGGALAKSGTILPKVLAVLNARSFYKELPPKSLGLEWVKKEIIPILEAANASPEDVLRTYIAHVAFQIASQFTRMSTILVTGGGAYNRFLLEEIRKYKEVELILPDAILLEFKEALIFGLLGVLKLRGEVNCLSSVTGASQDHSSGVVYEC